MVVQIPPTNSPDYRMVLDEGASTPSVMIHGNCGCPETNISGPGLHEVEVNLDAPPAGGLLPPAADAPTSPSSRSNPTGKRRSASLENIAWLPGGRKAPGQPAGRRQQRGVPDLAAVGERR